MRRLVALFAAKRSWEQDEKIAVAAAAVAAAVAIVTKANRSRSKSILAERARGLRKKKLRNACWDFLMCIFFVGFFLIFFAFVMRIWSAIFPASSASRYRDLLKAARVFRWRRCSRLRRVVIASVSRLRVQRQKFLLVRAIFRLHNSPQPSPSIISNFFPRPASRRVSFLILNNILYIFFLCFVCSEEKNERHVWSACITHM